MNSAGGSRTHAQTALAGQYLLTANFVGGSSLYTLRTGQRLKFTNVLVSQDRRAFVAPPAVVQQSF